MTISCGHIIKSYLTNGEDKIELIMIPGRGAFLDPPPGMMVSIMNNEYYIYYINGKRAWIENVAIDI